MALLETYPTSLRLSGRPVLIVGGGPVAARHAKAMNDAGAQVALTSPVLSPLARELADSGVIKWHGRNYESTDITGVWFVVLVIDDVDVEAQVSHDAEINRVLLASYSEQHSVPNLDTLDQRRGSVALVGGGPGAEDLITVRGQRLLEQADVVVADRLGPRGLLKNLDPKVKIIEVGKTPGHHPVPQSEINTILVREALHGNRVVRLKGGDPYVLGRGGEEAIACREAGVDVEVVPGVTSAVSVPAAAGIPVTHRGLAKAFTMISGHEELENVPHGSDHTVVLLMGVGTLNRSMPILEAAGRGKDCPVAIIENGFARNQRVTIGTLGTIVSTAQARQVRNPAVVVVGDVVRVSPLAPADLARESYGTRETIRTLS